MMKKMNFKEINILAKKMSSLVKEGDVIALIGDLGTGKTHFVKEFAKELGIKENIKSPTFNYVKEYYSGKIPLFHFDVYRIEEAEEIYEIGFEDYLNSDGICVIEWANIIEEELPKNFIKIELTYASDEERDVRITSMDKEREREILEYVNFSN